MRNTAKAQSTPSENDENGSMSFLDFVEMGEKMELTMLEDFLEGCLLVGLYTSIRG